MPSPSPAASIMEHFAEHDAAHGYSQGPQRYGDGSIEKLIIGNTVVYIAGGDRDCSLGILDALKAAGFDIGSADYTGNMRPNLVARGWRWHPMGDGYIAKRGDIYLSEEHHTAMCVSDVPDMLAEFSINEHGTITGGQVGDQTGRECHVHGYYDYPWDGILEYVGDVSAPPTPSAGFQPRYAAYTAEDGWLPFVEGYSDFAGIDDHAIRYLAIDLGGNGWYQVCTEAGGWLPRVYKCDTGDLDEGCAGDGSPITGVRVYYDTPNPRATGWLKAHYRTSPVWQGDYYAHQHDDEVGGGQDGYAGDLTKPIDRFQLMLCAA